MHKNDERRSDFGLVDGQLLGDLGLDVPLHHQVLELFVADLGVAILKARHWLQGDHKTR